MLTIMQCSEAVNPSSGGYRHRSEVSFSCEALVPDFDGFFGSISA
jgi:hypothetical protein